MEDDTVIKPMDMAMAVHGALCALIRSLHEAGQLPPGFFARVEDAAATLNEEGCHVAAVTLFEIGRTLQAELRPPASA